MSSRKASYRRGTERSRMRASHGMSLIELVIAMVIVGILASIAIPSYQSYVLKSHRTEAKTALLDLASMEERYFSTQNVYSALTTDLGYAGMWPVTVGSGYYQVQQPVLVPAVAPTAAVPGGTPATYTFVATPLGVQVNDLLCTSFMLTSGGVKTATGSDPNPNVDCWN
jgi:type IV pilus assembly protein PilE